MQPFTPEHLTEINEWLSARGEKLLTIEALPKIGFIVPGVAVSFLYQTDTTMCMFHAQVTNPSALGRERFLAYRACQRACGLAAVKLGFKVWVGWTDNATVISVAKTRGAQATGPYTFLAGALAPDPEPV